jgi:hypothetical protein
MRKGRKLSRVFSGFDRKFYSDVGELELLVLKLPKLAE